MFNGYQRVCPIRTGHPDRAIGHGRDAVGRPLAKEPGGVFAGAAIQDIVARPADEIVATSRSQQNVLAAQSSQGIACGIALEPIGLAARQHGRKVGHIQSRRLDSTHDDFQLPVATCIGRTGGIA